MVAFSRAAALLKWCHATSEKRHTGARSEHGEAGEPESEGGGALGLYAAWHVACCLLRAACVALRCVALRCVGVMFRGRPVCSLESIRQRTHLVPQRLSVGPLQQTLPSLAWCIAALDSHTAACCDAACCKWCVLRWCVLQTRQSRYFQPPAQATDTAPTRAVGSSGPSAHEAHGAPTHGDARRYNGRAEASRRSATANARTCECE
jgi:hypothetical protein